MQLFESLKLLMVPSWRLPGLIWSQNGSPKWPQKWSKKCSKIGLKNDQSFNKHYVPTFHIYWFSLWSENTYLTTDKLLLYYPEIGWLFFGYYFDVQKIFFSLLEGKKIVWTRFVFKWFLQVNLHYFFDKICIWY